MHTELDQFYLLVSKSCNVTHWQKKQQKASLLAVTVTHERFPRILMRLCCVSAVSCSCLHQSLHIPLHLFCPSIECREFWTPYWSKVILLLRAAGGKICGSTYYSSNNAVNFVITWPTTMGCIQRRPNKLLCLTDKGKWQPYTLSLWLWQLILNDLVRFNMIYNSMIIRLNQKTPFISGAKKTHI